MIHRRIADHSHGLLGRSPDHVASFVTGMSMDPKLFGACADNISNYYRHMRRHDIFAAYAVLPPQAARNPEFYHQTEYSGSEPSRDPRERRCRGGLRDEDAGDRRCVRKRDYGSAT